MTDQVGRRRRGPARHERPRIDDAALAAARATDRVLAAARAAGSARWVAFFEPLPDRLRDDELPDLRRTARQCRAAIGPNDSIRELLPQELTEPFVTAVDALIRELAKDAVRA